MITSDSAWNVTQSTVVSNSMPRGSMMAMVAIIVGLSILFMIVWYAGSTLPRYKRLWAILNKISMAIVCAVVGAIVIGIVWGAYLALSAILTAVGVFDPMWILYAVWGFAGCAVLGAAVLLLADRVAGNVEAVRKETEPKNESDP